MDGYTPTAPLSHAEESPGMAMLPRRSSPCGQVLRAFLRAQRAFPKVEKTRSGTNETGEEIFWANLTDIFEAAMPHLHAQDLVITHDSHTDPRLGDFIITVIEHPESEQWMRSFLPIPSVVKAANPPTQGGLFLSADILTRWRRFGACMMLGIAPDDRPPEPVGPLVRPNEAGHAAPRNAPRRRLSEAPPAVDPPKEPLLPDRASLLLPKGGNSHERMAKFLVLVDAAMADGGEAVAREAWTVNEAFIRKLTTNGVEHVYDSYRARVGAEPPPIEGVTYPKPLGVS